MDKIIESVLGGVGAGVVVAIILGVYDWIRRSCGRKEQIRHIKTVIEKAEDRIQKAEDEAQKASRDARDAPEKIKEKVNAHLFRFEYYKALMRELTIILEDRSGELSYEQRYDLRAFLVSQEELISSLFPKKVPFMQFYEEYVFKNLYSLKWLKLRLNGPRTAPG